MKSPLWNIVRAALLTAGITEVPTKGQIERWGVNPTSNNRPNKRTKIKRAHAMKAQTKLNAKRKAKKVGKRSRK